MRRMPHGLPHFAPVGRRLQGAEGHHLSPHAHIHAAVLLARRAQHLPVQHDALREGKLRRLFQHPVAPNLHSGKAHAARLLYRLLERVANRLPRCLLVGLFPLSDALRLHRDGRRLVVARCGAY